MNIILGEENVRAIDDRYIVLELDNIRFPGVDDPVKAYCLVENLSLEEMVSLDQYRDLHTNLLKNYRLQNWKFCEDAIEHLRGRWSGELDTFYDNLSKRVETNKTQTLAEDWDGSITKV